MSSRSKKALSEALANHVLYCAGMKDTKMKRRWQSGRDEEGIESDNLRNRVERKATRTIERVD